jgi:hypothetical protein
VGHHQDTLLAQQLPLVLVLVEVAVQAFLLTQQQIIMV